MPLRFLAHSLPFPVRLLAIFLVSLAALLAPLLFLGCSSLPPPKDVAALGITAARVALVHIDRNTSADDAAGKARVQRIAGALDVASRLVDGTGGPECAAALVEALALADLAVAELEADHVKVPKEIKAALAAARSLLEG